MSDILQLISLSEEQLSKLYDLLDSQYAIGEEFKNLFLQVSEKLNISNEEAINLINAVNNLAAQRQEFEIDDENFIAEFKQLITKNNQPKLVKKVDSKKDLILKLTGPKPKAEYYDKLEFLKTGLIDTAKSFTSFCDIRPIFDEERSKILDLIPIVIMKVEFEEGNNIVFQLNEESFKKLKAFIDHTEKKMNVIKESVIKSFT